MYGFAYNTRGAPTRVAVFSVHTILEYVILLVATLLFPGLVTGTGTSRESLGSRPLAERKLRRGSSTIKKNTCARRDFAPTSTVLLVSNVHSRALDRTFLFGGTKLYILLDASANKSSHAWHKMAEKSKIIVYSVMITTIM
jgi:hypothetical protein